MEDESLRHFHLGDMPQRGIPADPSEEEQAALAAEQAAIAVPRGVVPEPIDGVEEGVPPPAAEPAPKSTTSTSRTSTSSTGSGGSS